MTLYLRLLAGLTSFISKRCLSHFFSIGPDGNARASSSMRPAYADEAGEHGERERDVADDDQRATDRRRRRCAALVARMD